ncbi:MAG: class I SAM-dependent methyltransferase [Saccharofermentanales bacterium]
MIPGSELKAPDMPRLSARLSLVAGMVPSCSTLIDIGTDHAFVPICCLLNEICKTAIASDIRQGPLEIAKRNALKYHVSDRISFIRGDGLGDIAAGGDDCIVIAGMGGFEMIGILSGQPVRVKSLILQPQKSDSELRAFLASSGYTVLREIPVYDRSKYYVVIEAVFTGVTEHPTLAELYIGQEILHMAMTGQKLAGADPEVVSGYLINLEHKAEKERRRIPQLEEIHELLRILTEKS